MRRAILGVALLLVVSAPASAALSTGSAKNDPTQVAFKSVAQGLVSPRFHARRSGDRVFYAGSAAETRAWLPYTGVRLPRFNFERFGLFAIFYYAAPSPRGALRLLTISPARTLDARIRVPSCAATGPPLCASDVSLCGNVNCPGTPWGSFELFRIDKATLPQRPRRIVAYEFYPCIPPLPVVEPDGTILITDCAEFSV